MSGDTEIHYRVKASSVSFGERRRFTFYPQAIGRLSYMTRAEAERAANGWNRRCTDNVSYAFVEPIQVFAIKPRRRVVSSRRFDVV